MSRLSKLLPPLLSLFVATTACAPARAEHLVDLAVVDRDAGQWLPEYRDGGATWIAGIPGHRYGVRLTNTTGQRVLVVLSVDGVNAVTGQTASPAQAGYVLGPWESAEIDGWRKSLDDVAQFVFTDLPDSYVARTGRPDNVGVIGVAAFRERRRERPVPMAVPVAPPMAREASANQAKAAAPAATTGSAMAADSSATQRIGTGHGAREWAPVGQTDFARATRMPTQVIQLRYDDVATLAEYGIVPMIPDLRPGPDPFPIGFVPDPPAW